MKRLLTCAVVFALALAGISQAALITGITRGGASSNTAPALGGILVENSQAMTDRSHIYKEIPPFLTGQAEYVKVANNDRSVADYTLTVNLSANADVYLFIDVRVDVNSKMAWVGTMRFTDTGSQIALDEGADGTINNWYKVYKASNNTGSIILGAQNDGDTRNMYGVAATVPGSSVYTVFVDAQASRHPISPYVYGVGGPNKNPYIADLNYAIDRMGGECETAYNWKQNAHNLCKNWWWISGGSGVPAEMYDDFVQTRIQAGAESALTITTSPWVATLTPDKKETYSYSVAKYGPQTGVYQYNSDIGNGVVSKDPNTGKEVYVTGNAPTDAYMKVDSLYQKEFVEHLINKFGLSTEGGVTHYIMDNEPFLWSSTHRDLYPKGITVRDVGDYTIDYGGRIKYLDPDAIIWGPELFTFWVFDKIPPLLQQLKEYKDKTGLDLLDVLTTHYYPSACGKDVTEAGQLHRNACTRTLWDPTYKDPKNNNMILNIIPRLKGWVNQYYPGLKIGITEWNWGAEDHINGATALADSYGIMGREGLYVATHWGDAPDNPAWPTFKAMKMYRNYDGNKSVFGDISVSAAVPNPDNISAFAAERTSDKAMTVMVINKQLTKDETVKIALANCIHGATAQVWQLTAANVITRLADISLSGDNLTAMLPRQSITLFVIPGGTPVIAGQASGPVPANGAVGVSTTPTLTWTAGSNALSRSVYLGANYNAVARATPSSPEYQGRIYDAAFKPERLSGSSVYYWRVDEQANATPTPGAIWQFSTGSPPAAPAGLSAGPIFDQQAHLHWNAVSGASSYNLKRGRTIYGPFTPFANTANMSYVAESLAANATYYFVVSSVNSSGEGPDSTPVEVTTRTPVNLALGKTATASSNENENNAASKAVDGNQSTRWSSLHSDPQWIQVDLGSVLHLDACRIRWESAYSKSFEIRVSNDETNWTTLYSTTTGAGGVQTLSLPSTHARYIRMHGTQRGTAWGHSMWEFEIFDSNTFVSPSLPGQAVKPLPADGATNIFTNKDLSWFAGKDAFMHQVYIGTSYDAVASATTASPEYQAATPFRDFKPVDLADYTTYYWRVDEQNGLAVRPGQVWSFTTGKLGADVNGDGAPNATDLKAMAAQWLKTTPPAVRLSADLNNDTMLNLKDFARLSSGWLKNATTPTSLKAWNIGSSEVTLSGEWVPGATSYKIKRGTNATGLFTTIKTVASNGNFYYVDNTITDSMTYYYAVSCVNANGEGPNSAPIAVTTPTNYARNKVTSASSNENGTNTPDKAVDGNSSTRWSSQYSDPQWWQVDMGAVHNINKIRIRWEHAAAAEFNVEVSTDGSAWTQVYSTTSGPGGTQVLNITPIDARYIKMNGIKRKTQYGYSFWEFELFGQ